MVSLGNAEPVVRFKTAFIFTKPLGAAAKPPPKLGYNPKYPMADAFIFTLLM